MDRKFLLNEATSPNFVTGIYRFGFEFLSIVLENRFLKLLFLQYYSNVQRQSDENNNQLIK